MKNFSVCSSMSQFDSAIVKLEKVSIVENYPFKTTTQAINYYLLRNPARQKAVNILELDRIKAAGGGDLAPEDVWAATCLAVKAMLSRTSMEWQVAFATYYLDPYKAHSKRDIADAMGCKTRTVERHLDAMFDEFEAELISRQLLEKMPDSDRLN